MWARCCGFCVSGCITFGVAGLQSSLPTTTLKAVVWAGASVLLVFAIACLALGRAKRGQRRHESESGRYVSVLIRHDVRPGDIFTSRRL